MYCMYSKSDHKGKNNFNLSLSLHKSNPVQQLEEKGMWSWQVEKEVEGKSNI